jgi:hypothetical protein
LEYFFWVGDCGVLLGTLRKTGKKKWRFGGEFVVRCVVKRGA